MFTCYFESSTTSELDLHFYAKGTKDELTSYGPYACIYPTLFCLKEGEGKLKIHGKSFAIHSGDILLFSENDYYEITFSKNCFPTFHILELHGSKVKELIQNSLISEEKPIIHLSKDTPIMNYFDALYSQIRIGTSDSKLCMIGYIYQIFSLLNIKKKHQELLGSPVERSIRIIQYNYHKNISIDELSQLVGCNPSYLSRAFKSKIGLSPKEYLIEVRLKKASDLLLSTQLSVMDIARSVGIDDSLYFSRLFHKKMNMTPSEYRKSQK